MSITLPWRSVRVRVRRPELAISAEYVRARKLLTNIIVATLFVVATLIPGVIANDPQFRSFMSLLSLCIFMLFVGMFSAHLVPRRGTLCTLPHGPLMFDASRIPDILVLFGFIVGGAAGVVAIASSMQPGSYLSDSSTGRFSPWLIIPIVIFAVFDQIRRGLKPRGITLSEEGIHWRDLKHSDTVAWEDLERAKLGAHRGMKRFYLREYDGELHIIEPSGLGSDPIIIAEVIEYFRTHPKDRHTLNDPRAALALVVEPIPNPSSQHNTSGQP